MTASRIIIIVLTILLALTCVYAFIQKTQAEVNFALAESYRLKVEDAEKVAEVNGELAVKQRMIAEKAMTNYQKCQQELALCKSGDKQ